MKRATNQLFPLGTALAISIHALVKRATVDPITIHSSTAISIHALVKRATYHCDCAVFYFLFQSTPS